MAIGFAAQAYVLANVMIGLGYLAIPGLVLPFLNLRPRTVVAGAIFFIGCFGSHADMTWDIIANAASHPTVGWVAAFWHMVQAAGTWAFILMFRSELAGADALIAQVEGVADERPARDE